VERGAVADAVPEVRGGIYVRNARNVNVGVATMAILTFLTFCGGGGTWIMNPQALW